MGGNRNPKLVLLGTAGGPLPSPVRSGIAQAVVVGGRTYVVDCGSGVTRQLRRARLLSSVHRVFLTHLHSDHDCDFFNLFLLGWPVLQWNPPVHAYGPGPAGGPEALPAEVGADGTACPVVTPENPTPGLADAVRRQVEAHSYDINIRMREAGRRDLTGMLLPHEIEVPDSVGARAPDRVAPPMAPVAVAEDDHVRVTAVLVSHAPVFPAFAYRFDTEAGSVVLSGDTAPTPNLVALAAGADILVHEVFDDGTLDQWESEQSWEEQRREHHLFTSHTPLSRVGAVAAEAGARRLVLTHFIPGDDTRPDEHWVKGAAADYDGEIIVGADLMELAL